MENIIAEIKLGLEDVGMVSALLTRSVVVARELGCESSFRFI